MRYFGACFLFVLTILIGNSAYAEKHSVKFKAEAGDKAVVTLIKTRQIPRYGDIKITFDYDYSVLKKTKGGYIIRWEPLKMDLQGLPDELKKVFEPTLQSGFLPFEYEANHYGLPLRIHDKEKTFKMIRTFMAKLTKDSKAPKQVGELMDKAIKLFEGMDEKALALLLAREAALLARYQQATIDTTQTTIVDGAIPNPFGKGEIAVKASLNGQKISQEQLEIKYRVDVPDAEMKALAVSMLKSTLGDDAKEALKNVDALNLHVEEYGTAVLNVNDGWARALDHVRNVTAQGKSRKETIRIILKRK